MNPGIRGEMPATNHPFMVTSGVTLGDTGCLQWFTEQRCQLLIASVIDERNGVWNTDGQKGKIKRKPKN